MTLLGLTGHSELFVAILLSAIPATIASTAALITSWFNRKQILDVHLAVNDRMTQLLAETKAASFAAGVDHQRKNGNQT